MKKVNWWKALTLFTAWFNLAWGCLMLFTGNPIGIINLPIAALLFYQNYQYGHLRNWLVKS